MANPKLKSELETLRSDANKIVADISGLSKAIGDTGHKKSHEIANKAAHEIEELKSKLAVLEKRSKEYAGMMDTHVKSNPYLYIAGGLGLGMLLGKLLGPKAGS